MDATIANSRVMQWLVRAVQRQRLGHGILLHGSQKNCIFYLEFLCALLLCRQNGMQGSCQNCLDCQKVSKRIHPNLFWIGDESNSDDAKQQAEKPSVGIQAMRRFHQERHLSAYAQGPQIAICEQAHTLTKQAANALLKALEEPKEDQYVVLLAPSSGSVLPTLRSRCQVVGVLDDAVWPFVFSNEEIEHLVYSIWEANPPRRIALIQKMLEQQWPLVQLLAGMMHVLMKALQKQEQAPVLSCFIGELLVAMEEARHSLQRYGNPQLILENLLLSKWPYPS